MTNTIRALEIEDLQSIIGMVQTNYGAGQSYQRKLKEEFWNSQRERENTQFFVFEGDAKHEVLGVIAVSKAGECAKLHKLMVDPKYWNNGVGKKLFESALEHAETLDVNCIMGYTRCTHKAAQHLAEEHCLEPWGFLPNRIPALNSGTGLESLVMYGKQIKQINNSKEPYRVTRSYSSARPDIKLDPDLGKVRITCVSQDSQAAISHTYLENMFNIFDGKYIEIEVPSNSKSRELIEEFEFSHGQRLLTRVAERPSVCAGAGTRLIRYASWIGEFPDKNSIELTDSARKVYDAVREEYLDARIRHLN